MNVIREIQGINKAELENGIVGTSASWHTKYAASAWVYVGNLPLQLTEGDVICVMSQFGEVEDFNLVRDESNGKSRGFAFVKYEDARSCVLAVDNFCGTKVLNRSIRVDHVETYRLPKHLLEKEEAIHTGAGHAYEGKELVNEFDIHQGQDLFVPPTPLNQDSKNHDDKKTSIRKKNEGDKDAKRKRKEDRDIKRREKNLRHEMRDERRRNKHDRKKQKSDKIISRGQSRSRSKPYSIASRSRSVSE